MNFLAIFSVGFLVTLIAAPIAGRLARRFGGIDLPKALGVHSVPTPRTGGLALYAAWLVALFIAVVPENDILGLPPAQTLAIVLTATIAFLLGFCDDLRGLSGPVRLAGQTAIATLLVVAGVTGWTEVLPPPLSALVSIAWVIGLMNAANLLDGMDGLVAGVTAVAAIAFAGLAALQGNFAVLALAIILVGCCFGFLRSNAFPANMFMGDGGSLFLGLQLAVLGLLTSNHQTAPSWLMAPALVLAVPLLDTAGAIVRRLRGRRSLFVGDRFHIYDLLALHGFSCRQAVHSTWTATGVAGIVALVLARQPWGWSSAVVVTLALAVVLTLTVRLGLFSPQQSNLRSSAGAEGLHAELIPRYLELALARIRRCVHIRNRHLFLADCVLVPASALMAFAIRLDGFGVEARGYLAPALFLAAIALPVKAYVFWSMGLYSQEWRYAQRREAISLGQAVLVSSTVLTGLMFVMFAEDGLWSAATGAATVSFPRTVIVIDALLSLYLIGTTRLVAKLLSYRPWQSAEARTLHKPAPITKRVLLVGAGDAGAAFASEMRRNPGLGLLPIGFLDDDRGKQGMFLQGLKVLGFRRDLPTVVGAFGVERVLLTMPTAPEEIVRETVALCRQAQITYSVVPGVFELLNPPLAVSYHRPTLDVITGDIAETLAALRQTQPPNSSNFVYVNDASSGFSAIIGPSKSLGEWLATAFASGEDMDYSIGHLEAKIDSSSATSPATLAPNGPSSSPSRSNADIAHPSNGHGGDTDLVGIRQRGEPVLSVEPSIPS